MRGRGVRERGVRERAGQSVRWEKGERRRHTHTHTCSHLQPLVNVKRCASQGLDIQRCIIECSVRFAHARDPRAVDGVAIEKVWFARKHGACSTHVQERDRQRLRLSVCVCVCGVRLSVPLSVPLSVSFSDSACLSICLSAVWWKGICMAMAAVVVHEDACKPTSNNGSEVQNTLWAKRIKGTRCRIKRHIRHKA